VQAASTERLKHALHEKREKDFQGRQVDAASKPQAFGRNRMEMTRKRQTKKKKKGRSGSMGSVIPPGSTATLKKLALEDTRLGSKVFGVDCENARLQASRTF